MLLLSGGGFRNQRTWILQYSLIYFRAQMIYLFYRRRSPSLSSRRRKSRSPIARRRKSCSPSPKRNRRRRSRSTPSTTSLSVVTKVIQDASEELRKGEEGKKRFDSHAIYTSCLRVLFACSLAHLFLLFCVLLENDKE